MHICVIGAGALGRVYGVRLAVGGHDVSFLVRPSRLTEDDPFVVELISGSRRRDTIPTPVRVAEIPAEADVALLAVKVDQIDDRLASVLASAPNVPVVSVTPLFPQDYERLETILGDKGRLVAAQPGVVAYERDPGIIRYWLPQVAPTLIDADGPQPLMNQLVDALKSSGMPAKLQPRVRDCNPATTIAFFPLVLALDAGGGTVNAVLGDKDLLKDAFAGLKEAQELATKVGPLAPWAGLLLKFATPLALKVGIRLAEKAAPEAVRFVEIHFGQKVHEQHLKLGAYILELARQHGTKTAAIERLLERTKGRG